MSISVPVINSCRRVPDCLQQPLDRLFQNAEMDHIESGESAGKCRFLKNIARIARVIGTILLHILIFPLGILWLLGKCCQYLVLPLSSRVFFNNIIDSLGFERSSAMSSNMRFLRLKGVRQCYRLSIPFAKKYRLDTLVMSFSRGKAGEVFGPSKRWLLVALGNCQPIEGGCGHEILELANRLRANVMMFNYPGVGASTGTPTMEYLAQAHTACLQYLEVLNPSHVIFYGFSLGTVVQGKSLSHHAFKQGIEYIAIKDRGPSSMGEAAESVCTSIPFAKKLLTFLGWEVNLVELVKQSSIPEIIVCPVNGRGEVISDFLFGGDVALGGRFLSNGDENSSIKVVKAPYILHGYPLPRRSIEEIVELIKKLACIEE